jgi:uncharacterized protein YbgA (DUF1722 family)/uncharacterized protein YbbK (DUF523 family)
MGSINGIKVGISSCLLGENVRYNGGHKLDRFLRDTLGRYVDYVPVCPEVECGLGIPREAMRLVGDPASPRLLTRNTLVDHTERMKGWAAKRLLLLEKEDLRGFIFKSRSPSSGMTGVKVYDETGTRIRKGSGLFARAFMDRFPLVPVEDDGRLHDAGLRENFIERIFTYDRWLGMESSGRTAGRLVEFHSRHKLLILSHSRKALKELGSLTARAGNTPPEELYGQYLKILMEGLKLSATVKKNTDVLMHIMGYFKKVLSGDEKKELLEIIEDYRQGLIPLVVPVTLLKHYVRKFRPEYLLGQYYLDPHPHELMLRNHV